ncbi:hypothetical protein [Ilumatobacter sp.]|uniref:hypothetical protein n=1 Tax=Ilumatobacter sp. TaxID=1967498 RepID=UPI003AF49A0D
MTSSPPIADTDLVRQVMCDPTFHPHPSAFPIDGSTLRLREQMARFSGPDTHPARRTTVMALIDRIDPQLAEAISGELTDAELARGGDAESVAAMVPTCTLARVLELRCDHRSLVGDVEAVVRVIGRGERPTFASDAATDRLIGLAADPADAVALASVLYQNFDATSAAIRNAELARRDGTEPAPAVERTRRVATLPAAIGDRHVEAGEDVVLEIASAGAPFGVGPHECPGRVVAEAIVRGATAALSPEG